MKRGLCGLWMLFAVSVAAQQTQTTPDAGKPHVVFERSDKDSATAKAGGSGSDPAVKSEITDADRDAVTFTRYVLDVRLRPDEHSLAVRAQLTVRNDSDHSLLQLPLQISSSLHWEEIRVAGVRGHFAETKLSSDADHTGELSEAAVVLPQPLAAGAEVSLDVIYSGTVAKSASRLEAIGTPADVAARNDWDEVSDQFVGLRGFGNVLWYPVAAAPVKLGDGDRLFAEIGRVKLRQTGAMVSIAVTDEARTAVPNVAVLNGTVVPVSVAAGTEQTGVPSLVTCRLPAERLGFQTMSLVLAERHAEAGAAATIYAKPEEESATRNYLSAAAQAVPLMRTWLGDHAVRQPVLIDLPEVDDAPFEARATLFTGLPPVPAAKLTEPVTHWLAHAYFQSPRVWLEEGVAQLMTGLATEQVSTRENALNQLDAQHGALALAEPADGTVREGGLMTASDAIFYRTKAAYVLWMLRAMLGDAAMQAVLKAYDPARDTTIDYFEQVVKRIAADPKYATRNNEQQARIMAGNLAPDTPGGGSASPDLHWFFEDWVYHDKGLPELSITSVVPSKASTPNSYLVAVNVANSGGAGANVAVTVISGTTQVTERMVVPGHGTAVRRILIQDEPVEVQVNDGVVPEVGASEHQERIHYAAVATP